MKERELTVINVQNSFGFNTSNAVYGWVNGKHLPSIDNFVVLADLLQTTIDDLIIAE